MDYFRVLDLTREPFSNSPDPELFFATPQYADCLQHLELAIRLRRGLNVVIGEIGVGKSTLGRQLLLRLSAQQEDRQQIETDLMMDPAFGAPREFLTSVAIWLGLPGPDAKETDWQIKEQIKNVLFKKGVDEKKIIVLIIDEGQKLPDFCLELLREFLNFETNEYKLLQIIIFAQPEFAQILNKHANFADRINHHGFLGPMTGRETAEMIRYRIMKSASGVPPVLFTHWGLRAIHRATGGYPRKVITLCHQLVLAMIIKERAKAGWFTVRSSLRRRIPDRSLRTKWTMTAATAALMALFVAFVWNLDNLWQISSRDWQIKPEAVVSAKASAPLAIAPPPVVIPRPSAPLPTILTGQPTTTPERKAERKPETKGIAVASGVLSEAAREAESPAAVRAPLETPQPSGANKQVTEMPDEAPKMLGQLTVRRDGSVLRMIRKIYGTEDLSHLKAVARANPQIDNINIVIPGETVNFPALPVTWKPTPRKTYRLQLAKKTDLKSAYSLIEFPSPDLPVAHLVPYWNSREGLAFAILIKEGFADEAAVLRAKMQLPPSLGLDVEIRETWEPETIFFAHP